MIIKKILIFITIAIGLSAYGEDTHCEKRLSSNSELSQLMEITNHLKINQKTYHTSGYTGKSNMTQLQKKISKWVKKFNGAPLIINVEINSEGGDVYQAYTTAEFMREMNQNPNVQINTFVGDTCNSACALLFLGGEERVATARSNFGFHKPSFKSGPGAISPSARVRLESIARKLTLDKIAEFDPALSDYLIHNKYLMTEEMQYIPPENLLTGFITKVL